MGANSSKGSMQRARITSVHMASRPGFMASGSDFGVRVEISCAGSCFDFLSASQAPRFT